MKSRYKTLSVSEKTHKKIRTKAFKEGLTVDELITQMIVSHKTLQETELLANQH